MRLMANKSEKRKRADTTFRRSVYSAAMSNDLYTQERFKTITSGLPTAEIYKKKEKVIYGKERLKK